MAAGAELDATSRPAITSNGHLGIGASLTSRDHVLRYVRRHHLALVALFVALGGVSYAATQLPKNSVGTKQLKPNAIVSSKVKNGSLRRSDFGAGQLPAGPRGATGPSGPAEIPVSATYNGGVVTIDGCDKEVLREATVTVDRPSRLFVVSQAQAEQTTGSGSKARLQTDLYLGATPVGYLESYTTTLATEDDPYALTGAGIMKVGIPASPATLTPGNTYTLRVSGDVTSGTCVGSVRFLYLSVDFIVLPRGF